MMDWYRSAVAEIDFTHAQRKGKRISFKHEKDKRNCNGFV